MILYQKIRIKKIPYIKHTNIYKQNVHFKKKQDSSVFINCWFWNFSIFNMLCVYVGLIHTKHNENTEISKSVIDKHCCVLFWSLIPQSRQIWNIYNLDFHKRYFAFSQSEKLINVSFAIPTVSECWKFLIENHHSWLDI